MIREETTMGQFARLLDTRRSAEDDFSIYRLQLAFAGFLSRSRARMDPCFAVPDFSGIGK